MTTSVDLMVAGSTVRVLVDSAPAPAPGVPTLGPSIGEYPCYDTVSYARMTDDEERNRRFRAALARLTAGRVVLDIGTGADLLWARESLRHGARQVVALEAMAESYRRAGTWLADPGAGERITLLHGNSTDLDITPKADVCVAEIIGSLAGAEGAAAVLTDARRRHLTPYATVVPHRCVTLAAPVAFRQLFAGGPVAFAADSLGYLKTIFDWHGAPFDVRLRVTHPSRDALLGEGQVVEVLDLNGHLPLEQRRSVRLTIDRPGVMDGVLTWLRLWCLPDGEPLDALRVASNWASIYFPLFDSEQPVEAGDMLDLTVTSTLSEDGVHPDYHLDAVLRTAIAGTRTASHSSPYRGGGFRHHPVHRHLFP
ncbi:protein arginine N-methyltransferase 1 [Micromonospora pallida]|uniref:Protein arginine N-methyltransferase 1 n=1 Tax=Micromonospora pallida TaxID=145854 RepID=A0A1C6RWX0_9ACTN|nr:hypothetical protein [Micromonospora pallida]SCL21708.1 protein arginine N-methyltransferase 1 [Micromonospora pallida]